MSEEFGPWIEHDGSGIPFPRGTVAHIVWADGQEIVVQHQGQSAESEGLTFNQNYKGPTYCNSWCWDGPGNAIPVVCYRIKKPRGLTILEGLLEELPEGVDA